MDPFYRAFEECLRGSRELIKSRLEVYLPFVEPLKTLYEAPEILDLGCGRGEWLDLMQNNGFRAKGVDLDEGMLLACRELNLDVYQADALDYLRGLAADSLSVVSAFHVVEHIAFEVLRQLVDEALRVLMPGGLLILETPNSENLVVGTSSFYLDPTHQKPLPAKLLSFVTEFSGFERVKTLYLQEPAGFATAQQTTLMNVLGNVSPDYAIIAQKKTTAEVCALFDEPFNHSYGISLDSLAARYDQQAEIRVVHVEEKMQAQAQWLQNEWNAAKQRIEELSKNSGRLEAELVIEQAKVTDLTIALELSAVNEHNSRQQIQELHNQLQIQDLQKQLQLQDLQNQLQNSQQQIPHLHNQLQSSRQQAQHLSSQLIAVTSSLSWRLTQPLRELKHRLVQAGSTRHQPENNTLKQILKFTPISVKRRIKSMRHLIRQSMPPTEEPHPNQLSPRATAIYAELQKAIKERIN